MASIFDLVQHYQHSIEKHPTDEQKILKCIDKLYNLGVTVQHLQDTGVGRTVNALRKEPGDVGTAARALVNKWKLMVAAEENSEPEDHNHDTTIYNGHGHGKDSDDSMNQSRSRGEKSEPSTGQSSHTNDHRHMNGNHSDSKRKYHSSEDSEPENKKLTNYQSDNNRYDSKPEVKVKSEQSDSESDDHSDSHSASESSESSDEDRKVKHKIKTEPTEKHRSSSSKHSSHSNHVEIKNEPKDPSPKKSHEDRYSKHKESRHSSEKTSSSKDRSSSSHKSSKEKDNGSERKHQSEHKSSDKERSSSSKHSSGSEKHKSSSNKDSSNEKQKKHSDKHESKSDKHRSSSQSHKSDKDKLKNPEKEVKDTHKSKESSSSKDKSSSSNKEKSRDRSSSSKEKSGQSHSKSEKKHSSSEKSKSKEKSNETKNREKESKHTSSSSHKRSKSSSSSKVKDDVPKKRKLEENGEESDDGIDCGSGGLSFAEALGMVSPVKLKKKSITKDTSSPSNSFDNNMQSDLGPATLLAPTAKLAPLPPLEISALPEISPNYKPLPPPKLLPHFSESDALSQVISLKNQRTKVFSGNKTYGKLPSLYELCVNVLQEHIDALEYTGGVPYDILKPVVDRATPQQLFVLEHFNPYLMEDTDHLWQKFCGKSFRSKQRQEMETWREMYIRCQEEQEHKLKSLTANIKLTQEAKKAPIKQTKMAYVDSVVKPPRNIARKQALHGTARSAAASPAARVAALATATNVVRAGGVRPPPAAPTASSFKPKKAPLMAKALQFMRGKRR